MNSEEREQRAALIQEFRYGVIAELTNQYLAWGEVRRLIKEKAEREYDIPYSKKNRITEACIKNWLKSYHKYGRAGIIPKTRSDCGNCRNLKAEEVTELVKCLEERPELTATSCLKKLQEQSKIISRLSTSSLSRLVVSLGMDRASRKQKVSKEKNLKFDFFYPLECVQSDDMHGFLVPDGKGKKRKAILMTFLDDATRRILYANFSFTERSLEFEAGIKHILKAHGKIRMLYCDNGSPFVSRQTKRILNILGIIIVHSKAGRPQGRGKQERFYRSARDQFVRPLDKESIKGLGDLNARFRSWVESEYHRTPHRGLTGKTPLDAWLEKAKYIVHMDPSIDLEQVFLHEESRKVYKDSTLTLNGTLYEVSPILMGKRVKILFDPNKPAGRLQVWYEGQSYGEARIVDSYANTRVKRNATSNGSLDINDDPPENLLPSPETNIPKPPKSPVQAALSASQIDLLSAQGGKDE